MTNRTTPKPAEPDRFRVKAGFCQFAGGKWEEVRVANSTAEILFAVECRAEESVAESSHHLVIELCRGQQLRDRREQEFRVVAGIPWRAMFRLTWGHRHSSSSRLRCGLQLDGCRVGWWELLIPDLSIDAQGRFSGDTVRDASLETIMLYQREYEDLLDRTISSGDESTSSG